MDIEYKLVDFPEAYKLCENFLEKAWTTTPMCAILGVRLNVDYETLLSISNQNILKCLVGFNRNGEAVSVFCGLISPCIHSKHTLVATEIIWHIKHGYRSLGSLRGFIDAISREMKLSGAEVLQLSCHKQNSKIVGKILCKKDFVECSSWYYRNL